MKRILVLIALSTVLSSCGPRKPPSYGKIPDFHLKATDGGPAAYLDNKDLLGAPWIASFIFTSCQGPCPVITARLSRMQKDLAGKASLVSFTVDPDTDTPEILAAYARKFGAEKGLWRFATGDKASLQNLISKGFKLAAVENEGAAPATRVTHSTKVVLVDASGFIRRYYDCENPSLSNEILKDLQTLRGN